jgi:hypothetical protein
MGEGEQAQSNAATATQLAFGTTLHTTKGTAELLKLIQLSGNSYGHPYLTKDDCPVGGEVKYYVKAEGSIGVVLAAATPDLDLDVQMQHNKRVWCCQLSNRTIYLAGEYVSDGRKAGPGEFPVPCTLEVTVNSANGTLALRIVGGEDLGVVIGTLPKQQPLHRPGGCYC